MADVDSRASLLDQIDITNGVVRLAIEATEEGREIVKEL